MGYSILAVSSVASSAYLAGTRSKLKDWWLILSTGEKREVKRMTDGTVDHGTTQGDCTGSPGTDGSDSLRDVDAAGEIIVASLERMTRFAENHPIHAAELMRLQSSLKEGITTLLRVVTAALREEDPPSESMIGPHQLPHFSRPVVPHA